MPRHLANLIPRFEQRAELRTVRAMRSKPRLLAKMALPSRSKLALF